MPRTLYTPILPFGIYHCKFFLLCFPLCFFPEEESLNLLLAPTSMFARGVGVNFVECSGCTFWKPPTRFGSCRDEQSFLPCLCHTIESSQSVVIDSDIRIYGVNLIDASMWRVQLMFEPRKLSHMYLIPIFHGFILLHRRLLYSL